MNIEYKKDLDGITEDMLEGFFAGWPNPPNPATHLQILKNSYRIVVAVDKNTNKVVGFINAISDGILTAYIPLLEVIEPYKSKGIGYELVKRMLEECSSLYMIDICHDAELAPYYAKFGAYKGGASVFRNFAAQSGKQ